MISPFLCSQDAHNDKTAIRSFPGHQVEYNPRKEQKMCNFTKINEAIQISRVKL